MDVATAAWPTRLAARLRTEVTGQDGGHFALRFVDAEPEHAWKDVMEGPRLSLHHRAESEGDQKELPWSGVPLLGALVIEDDKFSLVKPGRRD
jgi:hypothetical protein